jgi:hypothetical protein
MNIISDRGPINIPSDVNDIQAWEYSFPEWNQNEQALEHIRFNQNYNTNSAIRKVNGKINIRHGFWI